MTKVCTGQKNVRYQPIKTATSNKHSHECFLPGPGGAWPVIRVGATQIMCDHYTMPVKVRHYQLVYSLGWCCVCVC